MKTFQKYFYSLMEKKNVTSERLKFYIYSDVYVLDCFPSYGYSFIHFFLLNIQNFGMLICVEACRRLGIFRNTLRIQKRKKIKSCFLS